MTLYEYYNTNDDLQGAFYGSTWPGQTFTPLVAHRLKSFKGKFYRAGSPGNCYVQVKACGADHKPTGAVLASGQANANGWTTSSPGAWYEITLGDGVDLSEEQEYAFILHCDGANISNCLRWRWDKSSPTYTRGLRLASTTSGGSWTTSTAEDYMFEDWGDPIIELPTVTTNDATGVGQEEATLHGTLNNDGGEPCSVRFNYGKTIGYGSNTAWQEGKITNDTFEQLVESLDPDTDYHFRAEAQNSKGSSYGADKEFHTTAPPVPPPTIRKVVITHPAIAEIRVYRDTALQLKYEELSNLEQHYITNGIEVPVPTPATLEVETLAGITHSFTIPEPS